MKCLKTIQISNLRGLIRWCAAFIFLLAPMPVNSNSTPDNPKNLHSTNTTFINKSIHTLLDLLPSSVYPQYQPKVKEWADKQITILNDLEQSLGENAPRIAPEIDFLWVQYKLSISKIIQGKQYINRYDRELIYQCTRDAFSIIEKAVKASTSEQTKIILNKMRFFFITLLSGLPEDNEIRFSVRGFIQKGWLWVNEHKWVAISCGGLIATFLLWTEYEKRSINDRFNSCHNELSTMTQSLKENCESLANQTEQELNNSKHLRHSQLPNQEYDYTPYGSLVHILKNKHPDMFQSVAGFESDSADKEFIKQNPSLTMRLFEINSLLNRSLVGDMHEKQDLINKHEEYLKVLALQKSALEGYAQFVKEVTIPMEDAFYRFNVLKKSFNVLGTVFNYGLKKTLCDWKNTSAFKRLCSMTLPRKYEEVVQEFTDFDQYVKNFMLNPTPEGLEKFFNKYDYLKVQLKSFEKACDDIKIAFRDLYPKIENLTNMMAEIHSRIFEDFEKEHPENEKERCPVCFEHLLWPIKNVKKQVKGWRYQWNYDYLKHPGKAPLVLACCKHKQFMCLECLDKCVKRATQNHDDRCVLCRTSYDIADSIALIPQSIKWLDWVVEAFFKKESPLRTLILK